MEQPKRRYIIDCFDGMPVSWTIGTSPDADLVNTMLDEAISEYSGALKAPVQPFGNHCSGLWKS